jgi:uncharacterized protein YbaA (DUF1428 family)
MSRTDGCDNRFPDSFGGIMNREVRPDLEFGIVYEKAVFSMLIHRLANKHKIRSVCEYPYNDYMGNNSDVFEKVGCRVKRMKVQENDNEKYDLVWNFCEFEKNEAPNALIQEMVSLSKKYLLIVTQNKFNVLMFHKQYHSIKGRKWDHGNIKFMSFEAVSKVLGEFGNLPIVEVGAFDVPWFVLDFYEGGGFFRRFVPKSLLRTEEVRESKFENLPFPFKILLAHHHFVLCEYDSK